MSTDAPASVRRTALGVAALLACLFALPGGRGNVALASSSSNELVIELKDGSTSGAVSTALSALHWKIAKAPPRHLAEGSGLGDVLLARPSGALASATSVVAAALEACSDVNAVEENLAFRGETYGAQQSQVPVFLDDLEIGQMKTQDAFAATGLEPPASPSGSGVRVAVLDGGFDLGHEAISGRCDSAYDTLDNDSDPADAGNGVDDDADGVVDGGVGHGTAVAALIAVSDPDAVIIPIRVLDDEGRGTVFSISSGIRYALDAGAKVINLSLGAPETSSIVESALHSAYSLDVLCVASAGNGGDSNVSYPATSSYVLAITGVASDGTRDPDASIGTAVDAAAPSIEIVAPYPGTSSGYGHWYGTSFACALFSAAAARVLEITTVGPLDAGQALLEATDAFPNEAAPDSEDMGSGILDASTLIE